MKICGVEHPVLLSNTDLSSERLDLLSFDLSCICKFLDALTSASSAMNNDQQSQGEKQLDTLKHAVQQ